MTSWSPFGRLKQFSCGISRFASDFSWAYRTAFPAPVTGYDRRSRFVLRTLMNLQPSACWFRFLKDSYLSDIAAREPSLIEAVHRPFFDRNITATKRAGLLKGHFELFHSIFGPHQTGEVMLGAGVSLCRFAGKSAESFEIKLFREDAYKREGGVTLELALDKVTLLCLTFTLVRAGHEILIKVGGVQAKKGPDCRDLVRDATHALHGIQPRLLLIEALRAIANQINCTKIECISKENHIYQSWRYRSKKMINAEYDQLWLLAGGEENRNGNFDIPNFVDEKPIEARPSKKRSEYRRRSVLLESMRQQIHAGLFGAGACPSPRY